MRIYFSIDERTVDFTYDTEEDRVSLMQRFVYDSVGEFKKPVYTELQLDYGDDMPTWTGNIREIIKALERHYGYKFDLSKIIKKGKLVTEDPDNDNEWAE